MADIGFGVEAAARQFGLDFIPVTREHYLLLCHRTTLASVACEQFLVQISSPQFRDSVATLPGYQTERCGVIETLSEHLP